VFGPVEHATAVSAARPTEATLTLDPPAPPVIYEDYATHLTGQLSTGRQDRLIALEENTDSGWTRIDTTRTDATGAYAFDLKPADPGPVELRPTHAVREGVLISETRTVRVLDRRVYLFTRASYNTFQPIVMSGSVLPKQQSRTVIVQHLSDGKWI